jgi:hypothetical protein
VHEQTWTAPYPFWSTLIFSRSQVGSEQYATGGQGASGSFIGVEFSSPFDRLVISIQATGGYGGGFCIDDLRFEGESTEPTKEPTKESTAVLTGGVGRRYPYFAHGGVLRGDPGVGA